MRRSIVPTERTERFGRESLVEANLWRSDQTRCALGRSRAKMGISGEEGRAGRTLGSACGAVGGFESYAVAKSINR